MDKSVDLSYLHGAKGRGLDSDKGIGVVPIMGHMGSMDRL